MLLLFLISMPSGTVNGTSAVSLVASRCSQASGQSLTLGTVAINAINSTHVTFQGGQVKCREALSQVLDGADNELSYAMLYDLISKSFILNVVPAIRIWTDARGNQMMTLLKNPHKAN